MQTKAGRKSFRIRLDEMVQSLRRDIVSGKLPIGGFLPSESDLEGQFHLSNNSVRKGLDILVQEGLLEKIPRVGNRVLSPSPHATTVIKFGYHNTIGNQTEIADLIAKFHKLCPHIQVQPLELPENSYSHAIEEYLEAGLLDVVMFNNNSFQDFVENGSTGLLEPVDIGADIPRFLQEPFIHNGRSLAYPFIYSPVILCYHRGHLQEKGVPEPDSSWSWDDLLRHVKQLAVKNERFGFYFHLQSRNRWPVFLLQSGLSLPVAADSDRTGLEERLKTSLEMCRELLASSEDSPMALSEADAESLLQREKVSVMMTTYFFLNALKRSDLPFDVAPLPALYNSNTLLLVVGLAMNSKSSCKEAAGRFVQFLTSYETQLFIRQHTLNIPAHSRVAEWRGTEHLNRPSRFSMYREIIPTYRSLSDLGVSNAKLRDIQREVMLYVSGLQDSHTLCGHIWQLLK
ncbi:extracellular solute-binding protein [Paenibacillus thalictri]|uniref:Extracellular solute-binding protein n=1 Tax=Paenibacillus thalictri TaxID=2527873 RepID=A0A4Q9DHU6_9BACL|nr:extracellular solute-binding protein [Paenibacillus thalictri]TBL72636.1 extracellular solute-binding protein [Paenibacillus thalictri]